MATTFNPFTSNIDPLALTALQRLDLSGPQYEAYTVGVGDGETTYYRPVNNLPASYGALYNNFDGDGSPTPSGYFSTNEMVNGIPVTAYYDAQGNVEKYVAANTTQNLSDTYRQSAEWDAQGNAKPVNWSVDNGLFNSGITFEDATKAAIMAAAGQAASSAFGAAGAGSGAGASAGAGADAAFVAADASQLAAQGLSQAAIEQNLIAAGVDAFTAFDAAQLALQGIGENQMTGLLTQSAGGSPIFSPPTTTVGGGAASTTTPPTTTTNPLTTLTPTQITTLAKAGINVAGLLGGAAAVGGLTGGAGSGGLNLTQQDRSGVSSGSAQYSPEYYQAIQAKYNQMMPQQPRDVTTDLKSWYETKYAPKVTQ